MNPRIVNSSVALAAILAAGSFLAGCDVRARVYDDRPVYVERGPAYAPPPPVVYPAEPGPVYVAPQPIIIRQAPPPPVREVIPRSPGRGFVWVPGYHVVRNDRWVWVPGHWERPPRPNAVWVEPRYERHGDSFSFSMGFWK